MFVDVSLEKEFVCASGRRVTPNGRNCAHFAGPKTRTVVLEMIG